MICFSEAEALLLYVTSSSNMVSFDPEVVLSHQLKEAVSFKLPAHTPESGICSCIQKTPGDALGLLLA